MSGPAGVPAAGPARQTALVVDDHDGMRRTLVALLNERLPELRVLSADSVAAARSVAGFHHVDVYVIDVHLADGDGLQLGAELRRARPRLPMVFVSAFDDLAARAQVGALGHAEFVIKTGDLQELLPLYVEALTGAARLPAS